MEQNKLIAEFIGKRLKSPSNLYEFIQWKNNETFNFNTTYNHLELKFHSDWNWLMEVVERIEFDLPTDFHYGETFAQITFHELANINVVKIVKTGDRLQDVYNACVEFIKWYNQLNTK